MEEKSDIGKEDTEMEDKSETYSHDMTEAMGAGESIAN